MVNEKGETFGHLVTQFPQTQNKPNAFLRRAYLWTTPKGSPIDSSQQAFLPKVKRGNFSSSESQETQSENSSESQEESFDNLNPDSSKRLDVDNVEHAINEADVEAELESYGRTGTVCWSRCCNIRNPQKLGGWITSEITGSVCGVFE